MSSDETDVLPQPHFRRDTTLVRAVAVLLVVNSHLEAYYPTPTLADGGLLGLALFFIASGFGLAASPRTRSEGAVFWMKRRLLRIYPALFITVFTFEVILKGHWRDWGLGGYAYEFLYPTRYHFISKILVYYVVIYGVLRWPAAPRRWGVPLLLTFGLIWSAAPDVIQLYQAPIPLRTGSLSPLFLWLVFLTIALLGCVLSLGFTGRISPTTDSPRAEAGNPSRRVLDWAILTVLFFAYLVTKFLMAKQGIMPWLFPVYFGIGTLLSIQMFLVLSDGATIKFVKHRRWVWAPIGVLGTLSLEMYLVHAKFVGWPVWQSAFFPLNILLFLIASTVVAWIVHWLASHVQTVLNQRLSDKGQAP